MSDASHTFEAHRQELTALAYRMLGERDEADDVVQETWLRWARAERDQVRDPGAWLRRTAARISIDILRSARKRREVYVGPWLPEPIVASDANSPEDAYALAQECELALLWAMERLTETERAAFILREVFDADYSELANTLGRTEAACRQIVSRAARRVREEAPRFDAPSEETADLLSRFASAAVARDRDAVMSLLAPNVVAITDGGGQVRAALRPLHGPEEVAQVMMRVVEKYDGFGPFELGEANGRPALLMLNGDDRDLVTVVAPDGSGRIAWIYVMRNPEKLPSRSRST